jgi:hypothetical protein
MKFDRQINIDKIQYELIGVQRGGSAIYKAKNSFLRIGSPEKIHRDLKLHKQMEKFDFPVAKLINEGSFKNMFYFVEQSLGDNCFGSIFKKETAVAGSVSNGTFDKFLKIMIRFCNAQLKTLSKSKNWDRFRHGIHVDIICQEMPDEKNKIIERYKLAEKRLRVFPFGILHGDLTPFNIYPKGIIDLEDSFPGPIAFDIGSFLEIQNWFPETSNDEFHKVYKLTERQETKYVKVLDDIFMGHKLPKASDHAEDFNFLKGIWFTVRMHEFPILQQFRYNIIKNII